MNELNQSTHLFEYNNHSDWLQKTRKFDIKLIKNNQMMT